MKIRKFVFPNKFVYKLRYQSIISSVYIRTGKVKAIIQLTEKVQSAEKKRKTTYILISAEKYKNNYSIGNYAFQFMLGLDGRLHREIVPDSEIAYTNTQF